MKTQDEELTSSEITERLKTVVTHANDLGTLKVMFLEFLDNKDEEDLYRNFRGMDIIKRHYK